MSTFKRDYLYFLDFAKNNPSYNFIFKPHPALKNTVIEEKFLSKDEYDNYLKNWHELDNASVYDEGNYFDIFLKSDLLITDCSSFLTEYYPSRNPIILLNRKDRAPFDKFGEKIKKGFYIANSQNEIKAFVDMLLKDKNDYKKALREKILKKDFYSIDESAADKVISALCSIYKGDALTS